MASWFITVDLWRRKLDFKFHFHNFNPPGVMGSRRLWRWVKIYDIDLRWRSFCFFFQSATVHWSRPDRKRSGMESGRNNLTRLQYSAIYSCWPNQGWSFQEDWAGAEAGSKVTLIVTHKFPTVSWNHAWNTLYWRYLWEISLSAVLRPKFVGRTTSPQTILGVE